MKIFTQEAKEFLREVKREALLPIRPTAQQPSNLIQ